MLECREIADSRLVELVDVLQIDQMVLPVCVLGLRVEVSILQERDRPHQKYLDFRNGAAGHSLAL
jgi:hypothetical protein